MNSVKSLFCIDQTVSINKTSITNLSLALSLQIHNTHIHNWSKICECLHNLHIRALLVRLGIQLYTCNNSVNSHGCIHTISIATQCIERLLQWWLVPWKMEA